MTSIATLKEALTARVDSLVPMLLPGARRSSGYWHAADTTGGKGGSLFLRRNGVKAGNWTDSATGEYGDLIDLIAATQGCDIAAAIAWARDYLGDRAVISPADRGKLIEEKRKLEVEERAASLAKVKAIVNECQNIAGTLGEVYLRRARGVTIPFPPALLFHRGLFHPPSERRWPAVVACAQNWRGALVAVQRIYLREDGMGKAPVDDPKLTKGIIGTDAAVRLAPVGPHMGAAEGVETALSCIELFNTPTWAGVGGRLDFWLPPATRRVSIYGDHDRPDMRETLMRKLADGSISARPNPMFGKRPGHETAERARLFFETRGLRVDIPMPTNEATDWNDYLRQKAGAA